MASERPQLRLAAILAAEVVDYLLTDEDHILAHLRSGWLAASRVRAQRLRPDGRNPRHRQHLRATRSGKLIALKVLTLMYQQPEKT